MVRAQYLSDDQLAHSGFLKRVGSELVFTSDHLESRASLHTLMSRIDGHGLIELYSAQFRVRFDNQEFFLALARDNPAFQSTTLAVSNRKKVWAHPYAFKIALLALFATAVFSLPWAQWVAMSISLNTEKQLTEKLSRAQVGELLLDPVLSAAMEEYKQRLDYTGPVHIVHSKEINAYAALGGNIFLTHEFILNAESDEEILGVLAHEMAHIQKRHPMQIALTAMFWPITIWSFFQTFGIDSHLLSESVSSLAVNQFSRDQEAEADRLALEELDRRNISPGALAKFFRRMKTSHQQHTLNVEFLSTHPLEESRIESIERNHVGLYDVNFTRTTLDPLQKFLRNHK